MFPNEQPLNMPAWLAKNFKEVKRFIEIMKSLPLDFLTPPAIVAGYLEEHNRQDDADFIRRWMPDQR